jgi:hypothetical protein
MVGTGQFGPRPALNDGGNEVVASQMERCVPKRVLKRSHEDVEDDEDICCLTNT